MLDWERVRERVNADGEFRLHARFWNSTVRIGRGAEGWRLEVRDGSLRIILPWRGSIASDLSIDAPDADWEALLQRLPRPFYQDLYGATLHHGFAVSGDTRHYCAYYPAVRRLIELMREVHNAA